MPDFPIVSIIIPCYNQSQFLRDCIDSLLSQTFTRWEAIIVDDASTEGDPKHIVSQLNESRCTAIRHESNRGQGAARNSGFQVAKAQLILPLDSDDCLEPAYLDVTVSALQDHPDADCVFTDFQLFGSSNEVCHNVVRSPRDMLVSQWIPGPGTLMRKQVWVSVGGYSEIYSLRGNEDWDFWIAAVKRDIKTIHISKALYMYRRHPNSISISTLKINDYVTREIIYRHHKSFFDRYNAGAKFRAGGYLNSSVALLNRGEHLRAAGLALHGFMLDRSQRDLAKQAVVALTPKSLRKILKVTFKQLQGKS